MPAYIDAVIAPDELVERHRPLVHHLANEMLLSSPVAVEARVLHAAGAAALVEASRRWTGAPGGFVLFVKRRIRTAMTEAVRTHAARDGFEEPAATEVDDCGVDEPFAPLVALADGGAAGLGMDRSVHEALATMPSNPRTFLHAVYVDQHPIETVAEMFATTQQQVAIRRAEYLRSLGRVLDDAPAPASGAVGGSVASGAVGGSVASGAVGGSVASGAVGGSVASGAVGGSVASGAVGANASHRAHRRRYDGPATDSRLVHPSVARPA